jgi:hypothetical protein
VSQIRRIAEGSELVGSDCLSIFIPRPVFGPVYVKYVPLRATHADFVGKTAKATIPVAFSPWMLNDRVCYAPSIINGDIKIGLGAFDVYMKGPSSDISVFASQQRPQDPALLSLGTSAI